MALDHRIVAQRMARAALIVGSAAAIITNTYYVIYQMITQRTFAELSLISITGISMLMVALGTIVYYILWRMLASRSTEIFVGLGLVFGIGSLFPLSTINLPEGFIVAVAPLHIIVATLCVFGVPYLARTR